VRVHDDARAVAEHPAIDLVVEASGARHAGAWIRTALARGAHVVTANKQAIAHDPLLLSQLARGEPRLHCEGAVAAAVPVVRALRESLAGEEVTEVRGVLNGTTTFLLSRVEAGISWHDALDEARREGYAEADPSDDLSGRDAAAKLAILATIAWHTPVSPNTIAVRPLDAGRAATRVVGDPARLRLVATARRDTTTGELHAIVEPRLLPAHDPLAASTGVVNVVEVRARLAGTLVWSGRGAGGDATASALLADVLAAARALERDRGARAVA
jgi:homoserine dehydrogenase